MRYFFDMEFSNRGLKFPIEIISFGMVSDNKRTLYLVAPDSEFNVEHCNEFVKKFVLPKIKDEPRTPISEFPKEILNFIGNDNPKFIGYYCSVDWTLFQQIFHEHGFPQTWPKFSLDIAQIRDILGRVKLPKKLSHEERHSALTDAFWNQAAFYELEAFMRRASLIGSSVKG